AVRRHSVSWPRRMENGLSPCAGCISLLGMEGGSIVESQISASSVHYGIVGLQRWGPELARLNNQGIVNAWTSATHDRNPWIQIDMQKTMRLTGIITQGASRLGAAEFIKAYKITYSLDGQSYNTYKGCTCAASSQVFVGNMDNDSTKTNLFDPPIVAQYIRIIPVVCRRACTLHLNKCYNSLIWFNILSCIYLNHNL
uniref:F5/8 type C domain-containing protein n=1 Tax=Periophthalmus magnuspinnatus TaxID=409849 RepID=A0A3B3ZQQ8_9GOBI